MANLAERDSIATSGLTKAEAKRRLAAEGLNELPSGDHRTGFRILIDVIKEPMLALLLVGGGIYALLGEMRDAAVLTAFACLSVVITLVQEWRSEKVLEALRDLSSPRALVLRAGQRQRIAGRDVMRGDIIIVAEGDRVPADARLLSAQDMQADESLLTGEAVLRMGRRACDPQPFDPMEQAFHAIRTPEARPHGISLVRSYGLRPDLLAMSQVWRGDASAPLLVAAKGAPEAIAALCGLPYAAHGQWPTMWTRWPRQGLTGTPPDGKRAGHARRRRACRKAATGGCVRAHHA